MLNQSILQLGGIIVQFNQTSDVNTKAEPVCSYDLPKAKGKLWEADWWQRRI